MEQTNPFFHRGPIRDPRYFFGRQRELREVLGLLVNMQNVAVVGPARIGKTSLLLHLTRAGSRLAKSATDKDKHPVVITYVSLEGLADLRPTTFFAHMLRETYRQGEGISPLKGRSVPGNEITFLQFNEAIDDLCGAGLKLVWLLDEFDLAGINPSFDLNFFSALRHVASRGATAFVTASERGPYEVEAARTVGSPFADLFTSVLLGPFQASETANLISALSERAGAALASEVDFILEATSGWPFFVQMLAGLLFDERVKSEGLDDAARERVLQEYRSQAGPHLEHVWSRLGADNQTALLEIHDAGRHENASAVEDLLHLDLVRRANGRLVVIGLMRDFTASPEPKLRQALEAPRAAPAQRAAGLLGTVSVQECVRALVKAIEAKDPKLRLHCDGTARWSVAIGRQIGLGDWDLEGLKVAARLHDVGMVGISDLVLQKPARLTAHEREIVQAHPLLGVHILEAVEFPWPVRPAVRGHHERMDGSGYPDGLSGEEIPLWARILAVAETIDFMLSNKPWRKAENMAKVVEELRLQSGAKYDSQVVDAILGIAEGYERA